MIVLKTALIDWIGVVEGGVSALVSLTFDDNDTFEAIYWTHPDGRRGVELEETLLEIFEIDSSEELFFYVELLNDIELILPSKEEIYTQFLK
jgi:hypothetical protein